MDLFITEENVLIYTFCVHTWRFFSILSYKKLKGPLTQQSTDFLEGCFLQCFLANLIYFDQCWEICLWRIFESKNSLKAELKSLDMVSFLFHSFIKDCVLDIQFPYLSCVVQSQFLVISWGEVKSSLEPDQTFHIYFSPSHFQVVFKSFF